MYIALRAIKIKQIKGGITLRVHLTPDGPIAAKLHSLSADGCVWRFLERKVFFYYYVFELEGIIWVM